jgi:ankyrin repeat protein
MLLPRARCVATPQHRGNTALHFAVAYGFAPLAEWLRRAGAQPGIRNAAGRAAADGIGPEGDF